MRWYQASRECLALRKHVMRVDLHVHCGEETDFSNQNDLISTAKSILTSGIVKGLDVVGVVAHQSPNVGWIAQQVAQQSKLDIWVVPGQEYVCADKFRIIVYLLKQAMPPNLSLQQAVQHAHQQGGFVMAIDLSKRQAQNINKMKGSAAAPDAVEIYNATTGGYRDIEVEYPKFVSSAAKTPKDMEGLNVFTLIRRQDLEALGLLPPEQGVDYTPGYLEREDEEDGDASPSQLSQNDQAAGGVPSAPPQNAGGV